MLLEVSIGEALDKLTILEIKQLYIKSESKLLEIQKEINSLVELLAYKEKYSLFYKLLYYVNEKIWNLQDIIASTEPKISSKINILYNKVFELNQQRFRVKNIINNSENGIKEHKGYKTKAVTVLFNPEMLNGAIPLFLFVMLNYDVIYSHHSIPIQAPCICYTNPPENVDILNIHDITLPDDEFNFYNSLYYININRKIL
jgi:hypothetical protein